jgi:alpha/beta superfamily hydrolase
MLDGPAGPLEAILHETAGRAPRFAAVVCHPHPLYGGTMHNKVTHRVAATLQEIGGVVLRFNFRGAGRSAGIHDHGRGEQEDARAAFEELRRRAPGSPLWAAGFSFGSWVGLRAGAAAPDVERLIAVAPPVARSDFSFLGRCTTPKLVVQGEADVTCPPAELARVFPTWADPKVLVSVPGANHFFDRHLSELSQVLRENLSPD